MLESVSKMDCCRVVSDWSRKSKHIVKVLRKIAFQPARPDDQSRGGLWSLGIVTMVECLHDEQLSPLKKETSLDTVYHLYSILKYYGKISQHNDASSC